MHVADLGNAEEQFKAFGLPDPAIGWLPPLWRFSFWARRRLVKSLNVAIVAGLCPESAKAAKKYLTLVNDAVFFLPDMRDRIEKLLATHFEHQQLGKSAGYEIETKKVEFGNPPSTRTFARALFDGNHFPVQACLYVEHRARLYIMKALVDYWLAKERGGVAERRKNVLLLGAKVLSSQPVGISNAMEKGLAKLSASKHFRLFPVLWQTFLWTWGGFLLNRRLDDEFAQLERESGVPKNEIPIALDAFDEILPIRGGWFRNVNEGDFRVLILMPAVMRGMGAHRRKVMNGVKDYQDLDCGEGTKAAMVSDNNSLARLLDCAENDLVK